MSSTDPTISSTGKECTPATSSRVSDPNSPKMPIDANANVIPPKIKAAVKKLRDYDNDDDVFVEDEEMGADASDDLDTQIGRTHHFVSNIAGSLRGLYGATVEQSPSNIAESSETVNLFKALLKLVNLGSNVSEKE